MAKFNGIEIVGRINFGVELVDYTYRVKTDGGVSFFDRKALHIHDASYCIVYKDDMGSKELVQVFTTKESEMDVLNLLRDEFGWIDSELFNKAQDEWFESSLQDEYDNYNPWN